MAKCVRASINSNLKCGKTSSVPCSAKWERCRPSSAPPCWWTLRRSGIFYFYISADLKKNYLIFRDREGMKKLNPNWSTHSNATLWIPYRLEQFQFNGQRRHQAVEHIAKILLCDRFVQLALITLKTVVLSCKLKGFNFEIFQVKFTHSKIRKFLVFFVS